MKPLRRRLLLYSAPVAVLVVLIVVKLVSMVAAGQWATSAFTDGDADGARSAAAIMGTVNVLDPQRAHRAAGAAAVLGDRLAEADERFTAALSTGESCAVRVDLELVRETLGDRAFAALDGHRAVEHYLRALAVVEQAPRECFAGNTDPDPQRLAVRDTTAARLAEKLRAARAAVPPPPPPAAGAAPQAPPPGAGRGDTERDARLRLEPGAGDPMDKLEQILRDAAG